jgi:hypothetical protein
MNPEINKMKIGAISEYMEVMYFDANGIKSEHDFSFSYFITDMDFEAMSVFARLIEKEHPGSELMSIKLMTLYNN